MGYLRECILFLMLFMTALIYGGEKEAAIVDSLTIRSVFSGLKEPSLDILPVSTRLDMLDYYESDSIYKAKNAMEGLSELVKVNPDYLKVRISDASDLQIKILPSKKYGKVVMTIYTVGGDDKAADSELRFYNTGLQRIDGRNIMKEPALKEFFSIPKGSLTSMKEIDGMIPFPTIEFGADGETDVLTARLTSGAYMNIDDYNIIKLFLKPEVRYVWDKDRFKIEKSK